MLLNKRITSYAIIIFLAAVLILSVNAIAQTKDNKFTNKNQVEKKTVPQKKQIKKNVKPQVGLSSSLELSKKIPKSVSRTLTKEEKHKRRRLKNCISARKALLKKKKYTEILEDYIVYLENENNALKNQI